MEATVRTTWSIDWTAKGWGGIVVVVEVAGFLLVGKRDCDLIVGTMDVVG